MHISLSTCVKLRQSRKLRLNANCGNNDTQRLSGYQQSFCWPRCVGLIVCSWTHPSPSTFCSLEFVCAHGLVHWQWYVYVHICKHLQTYTLNAHAKSHLLRISHRDSSFISLDSISVDLGLSHLRRFHSWTLTVCICVAFNASTHRIGYLLLYKYALHDTCDVYMNHKAIGMIMSIHTFAPCPLYSYFLGLLRAQSVDCSHSMCFVHASLLCLYFFTSCLPAFVFVMFTAIDKHVQTSHFRTYIYVF